MHPVAERISKFELSAPAFWAGGAFAAGVFIASLTTSRLPFWLAVSAASGLWAGFFHLRSKNPFANLGALVLLFGLGGLRYSAVGGVVAGRSVANFAGLNRRMFISGRICDLPDIQPDRTRIYLDKIAVGWKRRIELDGKIRLSIGEPVSSFDAGDRIEFVGFLDSLWPPANPGSLDFARFMRIRGVEGAVYLKDDDGISTSGRNSGGGRRHLSRIREKVEQKLTEGLPPKAGGVIKGFVLGITRDIEPFTYDLFRKTGTLHLLAVSGANVAWVTLLPILFLKLFYVPLRWRYLVALALVWVFVLLTDLQASVLRAAIMFTFWTASKIMYREVSGLQSLGLSGFFLLVINPFWFFDIGFQLSYIAVFALIFSFSEPDAAEGSRFKRYLNWTFLNNFRSSVAVFLLITPLLAYYFNTVAWTSLFVNVAAIPLAGLITWVSLLSLVTGFFADLHTLSLLQTNLFNGLFAVQDFFGRFPHLFMRLPHPSALECLSLTVAGFGLLLFFFKPHYRKTGLYLFLISLTPVLWGRGLQRAPQFTLSVLEARGETVAVLNLPDKTVVIGGGQTGGKQHTPRFVLEPFLAYLGKDKIEAHFPIRFDSFSQASSEGIAQKFRPELVGGPMTGSPAVAKGDPTDVKFEYFLAPGDSVPFGFRLAEADFNFLFLAQGSGTRSPSTNSLFSGSTILLAPLDFARAESLSRHPNIKSIVSTRRLFRLPPVLPDNLFFTFRDGAVTFRKEGKKLTASTYLSRRRLSWPVL